MPHLAIQYSGNIATGPMQGLCELLLSELVDTGLFPIGGIRVRAFACSAFAIADEHASNAFVDMIFRIGAGRSVTDKKSTGDRLMKLAERHFIAELREPHFALSLEIVEIEPVFSWKTNAIHHRLKATA